MMSNTTPLIDSTGANTATTMADGTTYYAYISNSQVAWAPNALRCSATGVLNGYLGSTGLAANWRCVGMVRLSGGQFQDSDTRRWVFNSYNKLPRRLYTVPGYADDNLVTTWTNTGTTWFPVNLGQGSRLDFLTDMSSYPEIYANVTVKISGGDCWLGIGDVNQQARMQTVVQQGVYTNVHLKNYASNNSFDHSQWAELQMRVTGGTATMLVDNGKVNTLMPDVPVTILYGTIWD
jgi:hypothetical protein